ncbi:MAG: MoaD/ThiS family protein, partial [Promethearchaeota archaeon]
NDTQNFNESVSIILNHESLSSNISLASSLSDGDKIAFLLPISGG